MAFDSLAIYKKLLAFAFVFSCSLFAAATARIAQGPSNVAVVVGQKVSLSCRPDSTNISVTWYLIPVHSKGIPSPHIRPLNDGSVAFRNFSEYSFGGPAPGEILSLNYTRLSHAGLYRCAAGSQQATAQLIVLAWEPNCSFTFDRGLLNLSCIVMYNGYLIPTVQWLETMENGTESRTISESNCSKPSNNTETFNHSARFHIESKYVFKLNFANRNCVKTNSTAANIPNYEYTWKLKNSQIFYGPENVIVHPKKDFYSSSEILSCSSDSYPNSDFKWTERDIGDVHSGPILSLKSFSFRKEPYVLRCIAANVLTNKTASSEPHNVHIGIDESTTKDSVEKGTESSNDELLPAVICLAILPLVILTIFASLMVFRKSKLTRKRCRILPSEAEEETASIQYDLVDVHGC